MPQFLFSASVSVDFVTTSGHALTMASFTSPEAFSLPAMSSGSAPAASGCWAACGERCEGEGEGYGASEGHGEGWGAGQDTERRPGSEQGR